MTPDVQIIPFVGSSDEHVLINGVQAEQFSSYRRRAYRTKEFIIKVDQHAHECKEEILLWGILDKEDRPHFVPILCGSIDERWVCQDRLDITEARSLHYKLRDELWDAIIEPLCEKYNLTDLSLEWNWGMVDGVPMIYDYGQ